MNIIETDRQYVAGTYRRFPVEIVSGKGSLAYGPEGQEYIDMGSGIGVTAFGIADEQWQQAVIGQISKVQHMSNLYYTEPCAKLAELLCTRTGFRKVFFSNSGAEANECAIKAARKYGAETKGPEYSTVITLKNSFHGRTLTTLAATGQEHFHTLFRPLTPGFVHVTAGDRAELDLALENYPVCGILMECVQGEGGVVPVDPEYVRYVEKVCREKDLVFCVDEVQTGNGRTGMLYSYMNFGVNPDVVSTAKGLAGGLPMGATLLGEKVQNVLGFGDHGSTFGGNPVSAAAAYSVISRIDDKLLEEVRAKSAYVFSALSGAPGVESVTGMGLMIGIKTVKPVSQVLSECMEQGVLCLTAKEKLRLLPALNIPMELLEKAISVIREAAKP